MATSKKQLQSDGFELLRTKLAVPVARPERVERPRLEVLLDQCLHRKLAVVCSPAGFGKTTLLAGWLEKSSLPVGWVSLDEHDGEPVRFWSYATAALEGCRPGAAGEAAAMLSSRQPPPIGTVLTDLLNSVSRVPEDLLLVFDDYHLITNPAVHDSVEFMLAHLPQNLHLIVMSREELPVPLAGLRANAALVEITADDLRFSLDEAGEFFRKAAGIALGASEIVSIDELTEGWAAALQLTALSLGARSPAARASGVDSHAGGPTGQHDPAQLFAGFSGSRQYLFDYLAEEVFARLDEPTRSFLGKTAWLDRLSPSLCDEVTGEDGGRARLESIERLNLFLFPLDNERTWYRYHRLFREFLKAQARRSLADDEVREIQRRASEWFRKKGLANEALGYAFAADEPELAADILTDFSSGFFLTSDLITLREWIGRLPERSLEQRPGLCVIYSWALLATGHGAEVGRVLRLIETALGVLADGSPESRSTSPRTRCALAEISAIRSSVAFASFDLGEIKMQSLRALDYLPERVEEAVFNRPRDIRATAMFNLSLAYEHEGDIEGALAMFEQALEANRETENIHLIPMILAHLANLHAMQGRLTQAARIYRQVVEGSMGALPDGSPSPLSALAYVGYGSILLERNRIEEAVGYLQKGVELAKRWANWEGIFPGLVARSRAESALGDLHGAAETIGELASIAEELKLPATARSAIDTYSAYYAIRCGGRPGAFVDRAREFLGKFGAVPILQETEAIVWCKVLFEGGALEEASDHLYRIGEAMRTGSRFGRLIEDLALLALVESSGGEEKAAEQHLEEALALGEPEGYQRVFLDLGSPMVRLLERSGSEYGSRLLTLFRSPGSLAAQARAGPGVSISDRELDVLRDLAAGFSNQETADRLFISVNTVKTHVKNIFAKLEVGSRAQAIARAHELGLLSPGSSPR